MVPVVCKAGLIFTPFGLSLPKLFAKAEPKDTPDTAAVRVRGVEPEFWSARGLL